jgi:hypothetical protein
MVIKTTPEIFDQAEIAEVDDFKPGPKTPQHDDMQRCLYLNSRAAL